MKTAAKIFTWLAMILPAMSFVQCFSWLVLASGVSDNRYVGVVILYLLVVFGIALTPSIVFGVLSLKRLNSAQCRADLPVWLSVCNLIFVSRVSGILMLCMQNEDFTPTGEAHDEAETDQN